MHDATSLANTCASRPCGNSLPNGKAPHPGGSRWKIPRPWSGCPPCRAVARHSIGHCLKKDSGPARSSSGCSAARATERPRWLSACRSAVAACRGGGAVVVLDRTGEFYPLAAVAQGIEPARLIVVHPGNKADHTWALDQALRCPAVAAVVAWPESLRRKTRRPDLPPAATGRRTRRRPGPVDPAGKRASPSPPGPTCGCWSNRCPAPRLMAGRGGCASCSCVAAVAGTMYRMVVAWRANRRSGDRS